MFERVKVKPIRSSNGCIQIWTVCVGYWEYYSSVSHEGCMRFAHKYAGTMVERANYGGGFDSAGK